jgi:hypothetical protein
VFFYSYYLYSNVVDIFDSLSGTWNTTTLSQARGYFAATSLRNLAFFGGGQIGSRTFNVVDIFNSTSQTWSISTLSQARSRLSVASIGEIVAFGGGYDGFTHSSVVDMFNVTSNTWFTANLSQPRFYLASSSSTNKIFFGGGMLSNIVDIFDFNPPLPVQLPSIVPQSQQITPPIPFVSTSNYSTMTPTSTLMTSLQELSSMTKSSGTLNAFL